MNEYHDINIGKAPVRSICSMWFTEVDNITMCSIAGNSIERHEAYSADITGFESG